MPPIKQPPSMRKAGGSIPGCTRTMVEKWYLLLPHLMLNTQRTEVVFQMRFQTGHILYCIYIYI